MPPVRQVFVVARALRGEATTDYELHRCRPKFPGPVGAPPTPGAEPIFGLS